MDSSKSTRRHFLKQSAFIASAPFILSSCATPYYQGKRTSASGRIVLGGIGLGPRGRKVLKSFLQYDDCQFVAIADPQKERREIVKRLVDRTYGNDDCRTYEDMHEVLARPDIDAVIIATGDRWHTTASVYAARAGKDIYCEKPCAMNIQECQELDNEVRRHGRIFQAGTQRRSVPNFRKAVELAKSGQLGKLKTVHAGILELTNYLEPLPAEPEPDPAIINWDRWLGPAPHLPFNRDYCRGRWRDHQGLYAAYRLPEWGAHTLDLCQWASGADGTTPIEFESHGNGMIHANYANGIKLTIRLAGFQGEGNWIEGIGTCPVRFEGEEAWVEAGDFKRIECSRPELLGGKAYDELAGTDPSLHVRNFLDCVKSRRQPVCNSSVVRYGHMACFAAATSWKLGRRLRFDPRTEHFLNDHEANETIGYHRRAPYTI